MTTYNTGNPVGSTDPRDLYDNAEVFDRAINDPSQTFTDRLGNERPTLKRLESDYPMAGVYAGQAAQSAFDAASAKDLATSAKTAAETARDATVVGAAPTVYATTAAGLAATTSGKYFSVPSADSSEYLILYLNNAGVAVEQKRYRINSDVQFVSKNAAGVQWGVQDSAGNFGLTLDENGFVSAKSFSADAFDGDYKPTNDGGVFVTGLDQSPQGFKTVVVDSAGNACQATDGSGAIHATKIIVDEIQLTGLAPLGGDARRYVKQFGGDFHYDVNGVNSYGQSNSIGEGTAKRALSTAQLYNDLMFNGGVITAGLFNPVATPPAVGEYTPAQRASNRTSLVPAVEGVGFNAETGVVAAMSAVHSLIESENGMPYTSLSFQMLGAAAGVGNTSLSELSKGGLYYPTLIEDVQAGYNLATAQNKTFAQRALFMTQGEKGPYTGWKPLMSTLISDFNADAKAITGQTQDIPAISYQTGTEFNFGARPLVAWQQEELARENALFTVACPSYFLEYQDSYHFPNTSHLWRGLYYGVAYKRWLVDGVKPMPLTPTSVSRSGKIVTIQFDPAVRPLKFDTDQVALAANYGFELFQADGTTPITIASVAITGPATVKIIAAATVPSGAVLQYASQAVSPTTNVRRAGPRGNLRDSQGDVLQIQAFGNNFVMHNWCLAFKRSI